MNYLTKTISFSLIASLALLASCSRYIAQPMDAPEGHYCESQSLSPLDAYNTATVLKVQSNLEESLPSIYSKNLTLTIRQSLIATNTFQSVNGLKSSTFDPNRRNPIETKSLTIKPELTQFNLQKENPTINVRYTFIDDASSEIIGVIEVNGDGGAAGVNSAIQGVGIGLKKALYDHSNQI